MTSHTTKRRPTRAGLLWALGAQFMCITTIMITTLTGKLLPSHVILPLALFAWAVSAVLWVEVHERRLG